MKYIQKIIPSAIKAVERHIVRDGKVDKEFNGYISSFGASIISAGLLPSVIFFSQKGDSAVGRHKIIAAIEEILRQEGGILYEALGKEEKTNNKANIRLLDVIKQRIGERQYINQLTEKISDAAIAVKLAISTFPKSN